MKSQKQFISDNFVSCSLAKKLREKEFNEQCFGGWDSKNKWTFHPDSDIKVDAPLYQQVFDWFQNKHNIILANNMTYDCINDKVVKIGYNYKLTMTGMTGSPMFLIYTKECKTLKSAREEAIKHALNFI